jgi:hypothetical protein
VLLASGAALALVSLLVVTLPSEAADQLLSRNKPVLTSSDESSSLDGPKAVDGNPSTRWGSDESDPQWIRIDLGGTYAVSRVKLSWEDGYAKSYKIQFSNDGSSWSTKYSTSSGNGGTDDITTLSGDTRYVRMYGTERGSPWGYSLWEFEVYGTAAAAPISRNKPATASSSEDSTKTPDKAVDGNTSTRWGSDESDPQWIRIDLGQTSTITRVRLNWEDGYAKAYTIQVSPNGTTWSTIVNVTNGDGGIDDHTGLAAQGRYVRMYGTERGSPWGYSIWEFDVYGTLGDTPTPSPTATSTPTPTMSPTASPTVSPTVSATTSPTTSPTPSPTESTTSNLKWAGVRSSTYGIRDDAKIPFPTGAQWESAMKTMSGYFPGSTPTASIWLVGEVDYAGGGMMLEFPKPNDGKTYSSLYNFGTTDKHEPYLSYFDTHGIGVWLEIEPGDADIPTLIDLVLNQYQQHPSVLGIAIDVEWINKTSDTDVETPVTDAQAQAWEQKVKSHNAAYRLVLKHYDYLYLPPTYRGGIIFVDDTEQNGSYTAFLADHKGFADHFYPSDVMFQIGYPSDRSWWSQRPAPIPQNLGDALSAQTRQNCGVLWVDFSIDDPLINLIP